jgi:Tol biopolymer transport system component
MSSVVIGAIGVVFSAALIAACAGTDESGPRTQTTPERIVFASKRGESFDIYVMASDGTDLRRLTRTPMDETPTGWSPDGTAIAFVRERDQGGEGDLYVIDADGSGERRVTDGRMRVSDAAWSPDGSRFAVTTCDERPCRIETIGADGGGRRGLTEGPFDFGASWSPDGARLVFAHVEGQSHDRHLELYVVNADGSGRRRLTRNGFLDAGPDWSPDGSSIVFSSNRAPSARCLWHDCSGSTSELYTMNADGSLITRLTRHPGDDVSPGWSTAGEKVVFARIRDERDDYELYAMNANGGCETRLTDNDAWDVAPAFGGTDLGPLQCVDVAVSASKGAEVARVGRRLSFSVKVRNVGTLPATATTLALAVPNSAVLVAVRPSQGRCSGARQIRCTLDTLAAGATVDVRLDVRAVAGARLVLQSSASASERDPNRRNDRAAAATLVCSLLGGGGDDRLVGSDGNDVICARGGDDVIRARGGSDVVYGDDGDDDMLGGAGADILHGGPGDDRVVGGSGRDRIDGGPGCDTVHARDGEPDVVRGDEGRTTVDRDANGVARERGFVTLDRPCRPR